MLEWLHLLRLEEYFETLCDQGYDSVDKVTELTWEDLEEIGIQKLGKGLLLNFIVIHYILYLVMKLYLFVLITNWLCFLITKKVIF